MKRKPAKGDLRRNKLHIPHPVRRLRRTGVVRSVVPPFPTRIASLDSRGSPVPFAIPLKRPRRGLRPPSLDFPRGLVCAEFVFRLSKRATDASLIDRRGIRNTLRLFRVVLHGRPSVRDTRCSPCRKDGFSTSIRQIFNGRKRSDSHGVSCAWETRLNGRPKGVRTTACVTTKRRTERRAFQARQRYLASSGLFFHIFSAKTEKIWPAERR